MHLPSTTVNSSSGYCGAVCIRVFRARKLSLLMTVVDQPLQSNRPRGTRDPGPGSAGIAPLRPRRTLTSCTCTTHPQSSACHVRAIFTNRPILATLVSNIAPPCIFSRSHGQCANIHLKTQVPSLPARHFLFTTSEGTSCLSSLWRAVN